MLACGRRWGKTTLGVDRLIGPAMDGFPVGWFSPTYKMLAEVWRDVRRALKVYITSKSEQQHRLELSSGGVVDMWSLDEPDAARGRKYKRVVIDEAAQVRDLGEAWNAVIRPTLTDYQGDGWFLSTPRGMNWFRAIYERGQSADQAVWRSWRMPTLTNPYIKPAEVESARLDMPERVFSQEYLAEFLSDAGGVFRRVRDLATAAPQSIAAHGHQYVAGVDWARDTDYTVLSVIDLTNRQQCAVERFNQIDYIVQRGRLMALCGRFHPVEVIAEANAMGTPNIEMLQREGLPVRAFSTTNSTKANAIEALSLAFERGDLRILPDDTQVAELEAYEMERLPSGMVRYSAPAGMHDDMVIALALAWQGAATGAWGNL